LAVVVRSLTASRLGDLVGRLADERPPIYAALAARLRLLVADGRLPVGSRLPPERELAAVLHVSRATVTAAYGRLREDGWADARQGSGTWTRLPAGPELGSWVPAPVEPGVVDLAHAAPSAPPQVGTAFAAALADLPRLLPGHGYTPHGLPELRARIADRFTARGLRTTPEQVLVTGGALHAVAVALSVLAGPGDGVLVEHPSYPNALDAVVAQGARQVPVPVSADDPDGAVRELSRAARQLRPRAAYLVPDFSNPTGLLLDEAQRRRLAVGLEQTGVVALVDETLVELGLDAASPVPFAAVARPDLAVTVGSMSKSFWGGLRLGWLRAEPELVQRCGRALSRTQMALPVLEQLAACHLLDAADDVLRAHRARLRAQRDGLVATLAAALPGWQVRVPAGGLVLWCRLPHGSSSALAAVAEQHGLRLAAGPRFGAGTSFDDRLRLPYTQPVEVLQTAVGRLAGLVEAVGPAPGAAAPSTRLVV
jgi:DNA-binding transcriptional MocR family regulator